MRRSPWWGRVGLAVALYLGAFAVTEWLNWDPEPIRLALVIGLVLALLELFLSGLDTSWETWKVDSIEPTAQPGRDAQYATYLRVIEGHLTAKNPDAALRERLAMLADRRLVQRHGVRHDDPRAAELLGPELLADLDGTVRRLSIPEIDRDLTRIEEL